MWARTWPDAINTGILTRITPDARRRHPRRSRRGRGRGPGARALRGARLRPGAHRQAAETRVLISHRRAVRKDRRSTSSPATAARPRSSNFSATGSRSSSTEFIPTRTSPISWFGGEPGAIAREDLPYIREAEARELIERAAELLVADFGYVRATERPARRHEGQAPATTGDRTQRAADWQYLCDRIRAGEALHDILRDLAAKLIASGMEAGAAVNFLRAQMESSSAPRDDRWRERFNEIPRLVDSAEKRIRPRPEPAPQPAAVDGRSKSPQTLEGVRQVAARCPTRRRSTPRSAPSPPTCLPGDPVWLGHDRAAVIRQDRNSQRDRAAAEGGAGRNADGGRAAVGHAEEAAATRRAQGGLLRQIGDFGIIALKDFGSILSMHTETRAEVLAALREIYDGAWTRHLGSDGGRTLAWKGKVGLLFAATGVIDSPLRVIGVDGRPVPAVAARAGRPRAVRRALKHVGAGTGQMRKELAEAVARLFAGRSAEPRPISDDEIERIDNAIMLAVRLRGAVARDRQSREIEAVYGAEGTARIGLTLERLLAGLDTLGVDRETAMEVVETVALDSVPPYRRRAYRIICAAHGAGKDAASTTDRCQGDGAADQSRCGGCSRNWSPTAWSNAESQGQGKADLWAWVDWEGPLPPLAEGEPNDRAAFLPPRADLLRNTSSI